MSLIMCPECGRQVSDQATNCPGCGCPIAQATPHPQQERNFIEVNGQKLDINQLYTLYSGNQVDIARAIHRMTNVSLKESVRFASYCIANANHQSEEVIESAEQILNSEYEEAMRLEQLKKDKIPYCPKCHSTSINYDSKKLSIGRALIGNALAGSTGAVLGGLTGKKGYAVCLNCGNRWKV